MIRRLVVTLPLAAALAMLASPARADERERCLDAYVSAQKAKKDKHLIQARDELLVCMRDVCPEVARSGCAGWLPEVQASLPTVVLSATDGAGHARVDVKVSLDGKRLRDRLDGGADPVDPGEHRVRWEAPGAAPIEETIAVREGAKNQQFSVRFPGPASPPTYHRVTTPWIFVLGGVGVVGGAGFAFFGLHSIGRENDFRTQCKPNCSPGDVSSIRTEEHAADVSLAVGVVATIGAVVLFATRPKVLDAKVPAAALATFGPGLRF